MNTRQPPDGPGFRNAHLAEQTRLKQEEIELLKRIAKALEKDNKQ